MILPLLFEVRVSECDIVARGEAYQELALADGAVAVSNYLRC